ncbi:flagellar biosynthetic protein FliR [bacterium]|nr:flagellar biosynthetic protein FliR [bacterium]
MEGLIAMWQTLVIGLGRSAALVSVAPVIGGKNVPNQIKVVIAVVLTLVCMGLPLVESSGATLSIPLFMLFLIKELVVGFAMGLSITLILFAFQAAGEFLGFQMMFSAGATFMAFTQERATFIGTFFYIMALLVFVTIDGHHWLIQGLYQSYRILPVFDMPAGIGTLSMWVHMTGQLFAIGMQLALPVIMTLFITNLMLGMMAKTMPQLNIFIVGLPIQIAVAFFLLFLIIYNLLFAEITIFKQWAASFYSLIRQFAP